MTSDFPEIDRLRDNFLIIKAFLERLSKENDHVRAENEDYRKKIGFLEYEISELKQKYETLKLAKTITSSSKDAHEAKIKINRMVRDIDDCIGLLNK